MPGGEQADVDWRLKALNWITTTLFLLGLLWMAAFSWASPFGLSSLVMLIPNAVAAHRRFPYSLRAHTLTGLLAYASLYSASTTGASPGALLAGLMAIVSAGLFLGVRGAIGYWIGTSVGLGLGLHLSSLGVFGQEFDPTWVDPKNPGVLARYVFTYATLSSTLVFGVAFVIQRLSAALERTEAALIAAEASGRKARLEAEAKESALVHMVEAQKFEVLAQLSASVAHDFNNSLQVIMANTHVLRDAVESNEELSECANEVLDMCNESSQMARQLLTLGERVVLERACLDIGREVQAIERAIGRLVPSNVVVKSTTPAEHYAYVDRVQLKQALLNLAINALHAMPDGGVLSMGVRRDADRRVVIEMSDTGVGLDEETTTHMFEPFYSTKGAQGSGLGLATVRAIVQQHQGTITVESEPSKGTTFCLSFPPSEEPSFEPSETTLSTVNLRGRVILVVDDDPRVRRIIVKMLSDVGAHALGAGTGEQAIEMAKARNHDIELLCTDAVMPGMPTRDLIQYFRERMPTAGILLCSAYVENELLRRGIEMREVAYLPKPFSSENLLAKITGVLKKTEQRARVG